MARLGAVRSLAGTVSVTVGFLLASSAPAEVTLRPGDVLVVDTEARLPDGTFGPGLLLVDRSTGTQALVTSRDRLQMPVGVAVSKDGRIYVSDGQAGEIIEVDPTTGEQGVVPHDGQLIYPAGMAIGENGEIFVVDIAANGWQGALFRIQDGTQTLLSEGQYFRSPRGIALLPGGSFVLTDHYAAAPVYGETATNGAVIHVKADGTQSLLSAGGYLANPSGIVVGKNGSFYVSESNTSGEQDPYVTGSVVVIDPASGKQSILSRGGILRGPVGIAIEASGDLLVVDPIGGCIKEPDGSCGNLASFPRQGLIRVAPLTGAQTAVSAGQMFIMPNSLALIPGIPNNPPVAVVAPPPTFECARGTFVTLDGSQSRDPDGDRLSYKWLSGFWTQPPGPGPNEGPILGTTASLAIPADYVGYRGYTLVVDDGHGGTAWTSVLVRGVDSSPPTLSVSLSPSILWPPNHKLLPVAATITASDACFAVKTSLVSITSSEPDAATDIQVQDDRTFLLRAERSGNGPGRVYTVTYQAKENAKYSKSAFATATVVVPHSIRPGP